MQVLMRMQVEVQVQVQVQVHLATVESCVSPTPSLNTRIFSGQACCAL